MNVDGGHKRGEVCKECREKGGVRSSSETRDSLRETTAGEKSVAPERGYKNRILAGAPRL